MEGNNWLKRKMILVVMLCFIITNNVSIGLGDNMIGFGEQPLSKIAIHKTVLALHSSASITASPFVLGNKVT